MYFTITTRLMLLAWHYFLTLNDECINLHYYVYIYFFYLKKYIHYINTLMSVCGSRINQIVTITTKHTYYLT